MNDKTPTILLLGPDLAAVSGVSTHLNLLFGSKLGQQVKLKHFQVGSEGRQENAARRIVRLLVSPFALATTILARHVDIVHLNTSLNQRAYWRDLVYMVVARISGARVVYQVHGGDLPVQFAGHSRILSMLLRTALSLPHAIILLAQCELDAYRNFLQGSDIRVFPNAIDYVPYASLCRESRQSREPANARTPLRLIYIGRLAYNKGIFDALVGLQLARSRGVNAQLLIAGSGPDEAALRQSVEQLDLTEAVFFVEPVFGQEKIKLLGAADVFLFPTFHAEGLPYALLECMAAGIPAITTRVGAIPDVVVEDLHGVFVLPRDAQAISQAITRLAENPALLAEMGRACKKRIESRYSIQRLANQFFMLYSEIGNKPRIGAMAGL